MGCGLLNLELEWDLFSFHFEVNIYISELMSNAKKRIGKYIIFLGTKLGKGAFSEVYLGI